MASSAADHPSMTSRSPRHPWSYVVSAGAQDPDSAPSSPVPVTPPLEAVNEDTAAQPPQPSDGQDHGGSGKGNGPGPRVKKAAAWKRPSNDKIEAGPVMGAATWPALSESAKASPKSSPSSDALKPLADVPVSASPTEPLIPNLSPETDSNKFLPSTFTNRSHAAPVRQKSMKRGSGSGNSNSGSNGGALQPVILVKQAEAPEVSPRDRSTRNPTNWGGRSGLHHDYGGSGDHHRGHGSNHHRGNNGGSPHQGRRDQERGVYDGYYPGMAGRESHIQQMGARPYFRPPSPVTPQFMSPVTPVQPFTNPLVYPDFPSPVIYVAPQPHPESFRPLPFMPHTGTQPSVFVPAIDPHRATLLKQIEYYFSSENLCKDIFLRQNMDEQGWVPITLIAGFNRVKQLTDSIHYVLETVKLSTLLEVQGDKIRGLFDWMKWVLPSNNNKFVSVYGQQPQKLLEFDNLSDRFQTIRVEGSNKQNLMNMPTHGEVPLRKSPTGYLNTRQVIEVLNAEGNGQVIGNKNSDWSKHVRTLSRSDTL